MRAKLRPARQERRLLRVCGETDPLFLPIKNPFFGVVDSHTPLCFSSIFFGSAFPTRDLALLVLLLLLLLLVLFKARV